MPRTPEPQEIWTLALAQIEVKLDNPQDYRTWFTGTKLLELDNHRALIGVRNHYSADWLRRRHLDLIQNTLAYICDHPVKAEFQISEDLSNSPIPKLSQKDLQKEQSENPSLLNATQSSSGELQSALAKNKLNPKYNFASFIPGNSNQMAYAAAKAVAEAPGVTYNPYFIYGKTGLGKTHLAMAIAYALLEKNPSRVIAYVPAETFLNEMINAIRSGKTMKFREKYRDNCDLLIIDDIQFISNWEQTQTEFFNTFNALQAANKQLVIISDRSPDELEKLTPRLRSRFQGGIVVDVSRPDIEHRIAIIQAKLQMMGNPKLSTEIINFIAKNITDNIRELEGALQKVILMRTVSKNREITIEEVAKQLGKDSAAKRKKIPVNNILKAVAKEFELKITDLKGERRTAEVAMARQVCMYILREELSYKLEQIAHLLNRKDHTTVIHGIEKVAAMRQSDEGFRNQLLNILETLQ